MYIDPKSKIAGLPALKIRDFLRKAGDSSWRVDFLEKELRVSFREANQIISKLAELGYIEIDKRNQLKQSWCVSPNGNRLALATAAKSIRRSTAERKLKELIQRVNHVNEDNSYLYKITKVGVFGSYLTNRDFINDIDIALSLEPKEADKKKLQSLIWEKVARAKENGRTFGNFSEELFWPQTEVLLYLKSRSRTLSLHLFRKEEFQFTQIKEIYSISADS